AGFFGKLPAKRDFVAYQASRPFLDLWEPWLQASLATSRLTLGEEWSPAYNRAPLWRFWLGAQFAGEAMLGALMASVDGVGRPFPLTLFCGEGGGLLPPPEIEATRPGARRRRRRCSARWRRKRRSRASPRRSRACRRRRCRRASRRFPASSNWRTARCWCAASPRRPRSPSARRGVLAIAAPSPARVSGGRSAAK